MHCIENDASKAGTPDQCRDARKVEATAKHRKVVVEPVNNLNHEIERVRPLKLRRVRTVGLYESVASGIGAAASSDCCAESSMPPWPG